MAATISQPLYLALNLFFILHTIIFTASGYSTHLIHRDSPQSPFYNRSSTHFSRLQDAFRRSLDRARNYQSAAVDVPLNPTSNGWQYFMNISIGTPPVKVIGIVDTGSHLSWTQCLPCINCYKQDIPMFDPTISSTYSDIPCGSDTCQSLEPQNCEDKANGRCDYSISYGDDSETAGKLASETMTIVTTNSSSVSTPNILFGCSHDTTSRTFDAAASGIIGLSRSNLSLVSQLGGKKFSYCLKPLNSPVVVNSIISFGNDAVVSDSGPTRVVRTPITTKDTDTLYYLTLEAITVGTERVPFVDPPNTVPAEGNIIIDSRTTLFLMPKAVHSGLESALDKVIGVDHKVEDPNGQLSPCYNRANVNLPMITANFKGGDVSLNPVNTFESVTDDVVCLTMQGSDFASVYGSFAQMNYLVGYDIEAGTVSFKHTFCID